MSFLSPIEKTGEMELKPTGAVAGTYGQSEASARVLHSSEVSKVGSSSLPPAIARSKGSRCGHGKIESYFAPAEMSESDRGRTREESNVLHARRVQEASDLQLARRLMRQDQADRNSREISRKRKRKPSSSFLSSSS